MGIHPYDEVDQDEAIQNFAAQKDKSIYGIITQIQPEIESNASSSLLTMSTSPFSVAHKSYVKSLYRRMLKNELDWVVRRDIWRGRAMMIRAEFERNR